MQTVLVVDDEITFLDILKIVLRRAGFQVLTAMDGQEGLDLIYEHRPHLVVLDDMLPSVSGGDICLTIKQDPATQQLPVILYSAGPRVRDADFIEQIGADAVMYKPFKPSEVLGVVQRCLNAVA